MIDPRVGKPVRAEDVGDDGRLGVREVALRALILGAHVTGIVDKDVEVRMLRENVFREGRDGIGIGDVERHRRHVRPPDDRGFQLGGVAAGDDDLVARVVPALREREADARAAAGDEDGVAAGLHCASPWGGEKAKYSYTLQKKVGTPKRSEEHTSELQSLMRISYAVFCLKKKNKQITHRNIMDTTTAVST